VIQLSTIIIQFYQSVVKTCDIGYFISEIKCLPCDPNCMECKTSSKYCLNCSQIDPYPYINKILNNCNALCTVGYYLDEL